MLVAVLVLLAQREPALRARFAGRLSEPPWRPWALGYESAILEEITFRLFAMSAVAWIASRLRIDRRTAFGLALATSSLLFGLAHLPAWLAATHGTVALIGGVLLLNGAAGLLFGTLFWRWGLSYAIASHFFADVVVQSLGPRLLA